MINAEQFLLFDLPADRVSEWTGMPEFNLPTKAPFRTIVVHFAKQADVDEFAARTGAKLTLQTKSIYFPHVANSVWKDKRYTNETSEP